MILKILSKIRSRFRKHAPEPVRFIGGQKPKFTCGDKTYLNGLDIYCWDPRMTVTIGNYCSIADRVVFIAGGEHDNDWVSTYPFIERLKLEDLVKFKKPIFKGKITIGNDVWIGHGATIIKWCFDS